jgi:Icc-related predicted phosphoesterase
MSTVKITELPVNTGISPNTANTLFISVDVPTNITGRITAQAMARGLYANEILNVGNNSVVFPNVIGQFAGNSNTYLQINLQNFNSNGSSDFVASTSDSDNSNSYIDFGISGKTFSDPVTYGAFKAYDSYLYGYGPSATSYQGNLIIGTASTRANIVFIAGGLGTDNIVGRISNSAFDFLKPLSVTGNLTASNVRTTGAFVFFDGTTQTTAATGSALTSQAAFDKANNTFTHANAAFNLANVDFLHANAAFNLANLDFIHANSAFNKANSAIANTFGVATSGDFYISGDGFVNGTFTLANSTFDASESAMTIKATATVQTPTQSGTMLQISGKANTPSRILFDSYSTDGSAYGVVAGRTARGTVVSPSASQNNDILMRLAGNGWGTTGFAPLGVARIDIIATENYTDSARGSQIKFYNVRVGSNVVQEIASFNGDTAHFTGYIYPERGFIYTPRTFGAAQTAITIDFANNVVLKANCTADVTFSFTNYTPGKQVEVWLTNTSGVTRTVTHGCSAVNSTDNGTTFALPSTSTAWIKYYCVDGDAANVYVTSTHA